MPCLLCNKEIKDDQESLEVYTTAGEAVDVHKKCYDHYVASMSCGGACSSCAYADQH
ncbi:MAG: hypothetical protein GF308_12420 [Candidatus Heimdallarchaeota archaeon]|nr:hypothetical protein [Candidatus Heimdallarchaeota archaeon]